MPLLTLTETTQPCHDLVWFHCGTFLVTATHLVCVSLDAMTVRRFQYVYLGTVLHLTLDITEFPRKSYRNILFLLNGLLKTFLIPSFL